MGNSITILGASMDNSIIFGIASVLQINTFRQLLKIAIFKSYEQMWCKTFCSASPIFVEHLEVKWSLYEFWQIL